VFHSEVHACSWLLLSKLQVFFVEASLEKCLIRTPLFRDPPPITASPHTKHQQARKLSARISAEFPEGLGIPPLQTTSLAESRPWKSQIPKLHGLVLKGFRRKVGSLPSVRGGRGAWPMAHAPAALEGERAPAGRTFHAEPASTACLRRVSFSSCESCRETCWSLTRRHSHKASKVV